MAQAIVSRTYTKTDSPPNLTITVSLSISGSVNGTYTGGYPSSTSYAYVRSKASAGSTWFLNANALDKDRLTNPPATQNNGTFSDTNSGDTLASRQATLSTTTTVSGTLYLNTEAIVGDLATADATAESQVSFSDP